MEKINVLCSKDLKDSFKERCKKNGYSMSDVLREFLKLYEKGSLKIKVKLVKRIFG